MRLALLALFIAAPLIELAVLIELGRQIGFWWTILIVVATAVIGTAVLQQQGLETLGRINQSMAKGIPPVEPVAEGFFLLLAGAFLLTPGVITDGIGFLLLVPPLRRGIARWCLRTFLTKASIHVHTTTSSHQQPDQGAHQPSADRASGAGTVIDGEYERVDETTRPSTQYQDTSKKS